MLSSLPVHHHTLPLHVALPIQEEKKSRTWMWVGGALLALVLAGLGLWAYTMNTEPAPATFALEDMTDREANEAETYLESLRLEEHTSELQSRGHLVCRLLLVIK